MLTGDFAPKMVELTDDVLFGDVWARPELSLRDRSMITCASLITSGSTEQLRSHLQRALDNGSGWRCWPTLPAIPVRSRSRGSSSGSAATKGSPPG